MLFSIKFDSLIFHKGSRELFSPIVFGLQARQSVGGSVGHPRDGVASCKSVWIQVAQRSWKCSDMAESSREPTEQSSLAQHQCLTLLLIMGIQGLSLTEKCSALFPQPPLSCWVLWNPIEVLLSPEDTVQIIIGFISAGDVDFLNELTLSSCPSSPFSLMLTHHPLLLLCRAPPLSPHLF